MALLWAHLEEPPPAVTDVAPGLPVALDAVLARGLAKQPDDRFPSCAALIAAVRDALDSATTHALPAPLDGPAPPLAGRASELQALREAWLGVRRGAAGALILVSGPRGAGKTRLLGELARELHGGVCVRYATAVASEAEVLPALAQPAPALIIVEDLDAAGPPILDALEAAARERGVLVAGSFRAAGGAELESLIDRVPQIPLGPLDQDAIRSIAELYAGEDARDLPLDSVLRASGGMPGSVHELVSEWARGAATRRLQTSAGRVAEGRADLRDAEAAVADDVQALQLIRERARIYFPELAATPGGPPFKGLEPFEAADADRFFGRERLIAELVARLAGAPMLCLVGASGSGKSSLLRAGLLPVLAGGVIGGSERWKRVLLRPESAGDRIAALLRDPPASRTLLAIDQLEEIFSRDRTDAERSAFLSALGAAASDPERFVVVLALRADFYGHIAELPELAGLVDRHSVLVGPMRPEELRRAIELPATRAGVAVEPELVEALVRDVADRAASLPLLSTTLLELWQAREGRTLTRAAYERSGGVRGAVARLAESAYGELTEPEQAAARAALLRLTDETASGGARAAARAPVRVRHHGERVAPAGHSRS